MCVLLSLLQSLECDYKLPDTTANRVKYVQKCYVTVGTFKLINYACTLNLHLVDLLYTLCSTLSKVLIGSKVICFIPMLGCYLLSSIPVYT